MKRDFSLANKTTNRKQSATRSTAENWVFPRAFGRTVYHIFGFFVSCAESICTRAFLIRCSVFFLLNLNTVAGWHTTHILDDDEKCFWFHVEDWYARQMAVTKKWDNSNHMPVYVPPLWAISRYRDNTHAETAKKNYSKMTISTANHQIF